MRGSSQKWLLLFSEKNTELVECLFGNCRVAGKSEYRQADLHNHVNEDTNCNGATMEAQSFACTSQNKEVNVTLLFPTQSDKKAEQEFMDMLKEIYLNKMKKG